MFSQSAHQKIVNQQSFLFNVGGGSQKVVNQAINQNKTLNMNPHSGMINKSGNVPTIKLAAHPQGSFEQFVSKMGQQVNDAFTNLGNIGGPQQQMNSQYMQLATGMGSIQASNSVNQNFSQFQKIQNSMPKISNMGQWNQGKAGSRSGTVMMAEKEEGPTVAGSTPEVSENHMDKEMSTHARDRFHGKTIVITGGAGDFGKNCGLRMASEGANVAILDIVQDKLDESAAEIRKVAKGDSKVMVAMADVTKPEAVEEAFKKVAAEFGDIHYVFNNAGYQGDLEMVHKYSADDFEKVLQINVLGVFNVLKAASNHMIERGIKGSIVNTASKAATNCPPNMPAYSASKGAVWSLSQSSAKDLAPYGIRVNSLSPAFIGPGFMWTRQTELQAAVGSQYYDPDPKVVEQQMIDSTPMRRYGSVEEVIGVATYLFSDDSSYITGQDHTVTGGLI